MKLRKIFDKATSHPVVTDLSPYEPFIQSIKRQDHTSLPAGEFRSRIGALQAQARNTPADCASPAGAPSPPDPQVLAEVFALVREASRRTIGLAPFDVQIIAGAAMAAGGVAELPTGEGKTLAAVFPACLHALSGRGVHVLTFNDYLARRDASWMGPIYRLLGLSVGCIQEGMAPFEKRAAYATDVTYATAKEAGFDFLRDRIAYEAGELVHRPFYAAVVDEADSILIDEARIPLVISGVEDRASWDARHVAGIVARLAEGRDYETDAERRNVFLTDAGILRAESLLGGARLYQAGNEQLL